MSIFYRQEKWKNMKRRAYPRRSESYKGSRKYGDSSLGPPPLIFFSKG
jgi:hypothetical protein